jgi:hypothetical protein
MTAFRGEGERTKTRKSERRYKYVKILSVTLHLCALSLSPLGPSCLTNHHGRFLAQFIDFELKVP